MKERPILFKGEMVRAILSGKKTQTRRIMNPQPHQSNHTGSWFWSKGDKHHVWSENPFPHIQHDCPYGMTSDRLWVRETFRSYDIDGTEAGAKKSLRYRADGNEAMITWKPSIFMPRWASRITLEITKVHVERLQEITEEDALAEGVEAETSTPEEWWEGYHREILDRYGNMLHQQIKRVGDATPPAWMDQPRIHKGESGFDISARRNYELLWDRINKNWDENPWVWVIEFKKL